MSVSAIILAAGSGLRAGGDVAKQWRKLGGIPVLSHCLRIFMSHSQISHISIVHKSADAAHICEVLENEPESKAQIQTVTGGQTRAQSVRAGLCSCPDHAPVLIHDGARPFVTHDLISQIIAALQTADGAAPALEVTDALWRAENGRVQDITPRQNLYRAQTPQGFHIDRIREAHNRAQNDASDDVEVALAAGLSVAVLPGFEDNIKITHPLDFRRAEDILTLRSSRDAS